LNQDQTDHLATPNLDPEWVTSWDAIATHLKSAIAGCMSPKPVLVVECYPGLDEKAILQELTNRLSPAFPIHSAEALLPTARIEKLVSLSFHQSRFHPNLSLVHFFDAEPLWRLRREIDELNQGLVLIVGCGASLIAWGHVLIYADLSRNAARIQLGRQHIRNLGHGDGTLDGSAKIARAQAVDWPVADRWKRPLINRWDFVLDATSPGQPVLIDAPGVRAGLRQAARQPFVLNCRATQQSREEQPANKPGSIYRQTPDTSWRANFALEDQSFTLELPESQLEVPVTNLIAAHPGALLGEKTLLRLGGAQCSISLSGISSTPGVSPLIARLLRLSKKQLHQTSDRLQLLHLMKGHAAMIESPAAKFPSLLLRIAETLAIPAGVGEYTIRPHEGSVGQPCAIELASLPI